MSAPGRPRIWTRALIIERIQEWNRMYGRPPTSRDWNPAKLRAQGFDDLVERFYDGHWPDTTNVYKAPGPYQALFSSWNEAIRAAGFEPRSVGWPRRGGTP